MLFPDMVYSINARISDNIWDCIYIYNNFLELQCNAVYFIKTIQKFLSGKIIVRGKKGKFKLILQFKRYIQSCTYNSVKSWISRYFDQRVRFYFVWSFQLPIFRQFTFSFRCWFLFVCLLVFFLFCFFFFFVCLIFWGVFFPWDCQSYRWPVF